VALERPDDRGAFSTLAGWLSTPAAVRVAGVWAFAEAILWFIVPDVWIGLVGLFAPRRVPVSVAAIILGAMAGAAVLAVLTTVAPAGVGGLLTGIPGIRPDDLATVRSELESQGLPAFLGGAFQGNPVKLYVHEATLLGFGPPAILFVALNRVVRVGLFGLVMAAIGIIARRLIRRIPRVALATYVGSWTVFYVAYFAMRAG